MPYKNLYRGAVDARNVEQLLGHPLQSLGTGVALFQNVGAAVWHVDHASI